MRTITPAILLLSLCGACSNAPVSLPSAAATAAQSCIPLNQVVGRHVAGPSSVHFSMSGPVSYRNDLQTQCPGMTADNPALVVSIASNTGSQLCSGDRIRVYDPVQLGPLPVTSVPTCLLGEFHARDR